MEAWLRDPIDGIPPLLMPVAHALVQAREVGRARLPSNVLGLLYHAAEHAQRHTGQTIATARILRDARNT